jgi:hypothetical protein
MTNPYAHSERIASGKAPQGQQLSKPLPSGRGLVIATVIGVKGRMLLLGAEHSAAIPLFAKGRLA